MTMVGVRMRVIMNIFWDSESPLVMMSTSVNLVVIFMCPGTKVTPNPLNALWICVSHVMLHATVPYQSLPVNELMRRERLIHRMFNQNTHFLSY